MIDRLHHSVRRGIPLALATLLVMAGCGTEDGGGEGEAVAQAVDDTTTSTGDPATADTAEDGGDDSEDGGNEDGGDDSDDGDDSSGEGNGDDGAGDEDDPYGGEDPYDTGDLANECPAEGCLVRIIGAEANGDEVDLTLDANFAADIAGNHFHIYWNNWSPADVSADTNVGIWAAREEYPEYYTGNDPNTSTGSAGRGDATEICVTPADAHHVVIDPSVYDCWDVGDYLG